MKIYFVILFFFCSGVEGNWWDIFWCLDGGWYRLVLVEVDVEGLDFFMFFLLKLMLFELEL